MPLERLFDELKTSPEGLTSEEAIARLKNCGFNMLVEKKQASIIHKFVVHFKDLFGILLLVASVLAAIGEMPELSIGILLVVLINVFFQHVPRITRRESIANAETLDA
jgi:Ca2+-transporting ATPase